MIILLGLLLLLAAVVVAVAGILGNTGAAHELTGAFSVFGHHVTGSTGMLFLWGVVVGAVAVLGLGLLLAGLRRRAAARRGPRRARSGAVDARERDGAPAGRPEGVRTDAATADGYREDFARQREARATAPDHAREQTAGTRTGPMPQDSEPAADDGNRGSRLL
ncbi:hypothetical protein HUT16_01865 [Kitasatospora sp. NA04385]|uniref:hypothetical protein n=1 Tax=Kitasatospora sp. NA04385 TaxID=2742135 RepID=UPI0015910A07|nr:hypothetical protein [Kitasatospora sp. NA04385]QKW17970.1 hypothetical protein HUT16_01865 [Kitasatospora sp. NA04385]